MNRRASSGDSASDVLLPKESVVTTDLYIGALLSSIGAHMDSDPASWFVVTSLDHLPEATTNSGRAVDWVPLPPINPIDMLVQNQRLKHFVDLETGQIRNHQSLRFLCDLGGHPRSLDINCPRVCVDQRHGDV